MAKKKKPSSNREEKFYFQQGSMQFVSGDPLVQAAMAPHTGRFVKLHAILNDLADDGHNVTELLEKAWHYADHDHPTELSFVIALAQEFVKHHPGEPLPFVIE